MTSHKRTVIVPLDENRRFIDPVADAKAVAKLLRSKDATDDTMSLLTDFMERRAISLEAAEGELFSRLHIDADLDPIEKWALVGISLGMSQPEFKALRRQRISPKAPGRPPKIGKTDSEKLSEFVDSIKDNPMNDGLTDKQILGFLKHIAVHYRNLEGAPSHLRSGGLTDILMADVRSLRKRVSEGRAKRRVPKN